ncbi:MAG: response regulator transcription factor [Bacteroidia bacterium]|nr:response regulator transcription factor [Bacteroidia bacterium]
MIRLVLIDDHQVILDGIKAILDAEPGVEVVEAFDTPQLGLDFLETNDVDVLVTDLDMPGMAGEDVVRYCKSKFPRLKVVVLSMHNDKMVIQHLIEAQADGYLLKSSDKDEIIRAIETVNEGRKYFSQEVVQSLAQKDHVQTATVNDHKESILTRREEEIVILVAQGNTTKEIASQLHISPRTVETHRNNIIKKLEVNGIAGLVRYAFKNGLIQ